MSDQYYFIKDKTKTRYYETRTNRPIALKKIPKNIIISEIKERVRAENINFRKKENYDHLLHIKDNLKKKLEKVEIKLKNLELQINFDQAKETEKKTTDAQKEYDEMKQKYGSWNNYFQKKYGSYFNTEKSNSSSNNSNKGYDKFFNNNWTKEDYDKFFNSNRTKEDYDKFFNNFKSGNTSSNKSTFISTLSKLSITTKQEWKQWLLKNHPDKGGDEEICKKVISEGRAKGW